MQQYAGICNTSSIGTNITFDVRYDKVVRIRSRINDQIDDGWLTDACRYSHLEIHSEDRLLKPQVRNAKGELEEASWDKALERVATELLREAGSKAILVGSRLSLEDGHSLLKLGRSVLETPHVVHEHAHEQLKLEQVVTGRVHGCDQADVIICLGCDPAVSHPAFELRIKKGLRGRAKLISLGSEPAMVRYSDFQAVGEPTDLWSKLVKAVKKKAKDEEAGLRMPGPRPWEAGGRTSEEWKELVKEVQDAGKVLVVVAGDLNAQGLTEIFGDVESLGWNTEPHGIIHLRDGVNSLGLEYLGLVPEWEQELAGSYQKALGSFNGTTGKSYLEVVSEDKGVVLAVGCDPMVAGKKPAFLVVAATHPNTSTEIADVVLPLSTWAESNGVFVSTDGTVQFSRQAIVPQGESKPAHQIAQLVSNVLEEEPVDLMTPRDLYAEIGRLNPAFAGASYRDFQAPGQVHWSYPQQAQLGMPRPDLSAIPVRNPDAPMWMPAVPTGSKVEEASRLLRGDRYPAVPGQRDPREIAAMLGLSQLALESQPPALSAGAPEKREGYIPLRVVPASSAQVTGPTPANRHHEIGVGRHRQVALPTARVALADPKEAAAAAVEAAENEGEAEE